MTRLNPIPTSYGPQQSAGLYRRRPGGVAVPLAQARAEFLQGGFRGLHGLGADGPVDFVAIPPDSDAVAFHTEGSKPKTREAAIVAALKTRGYPDPSAGMVAALAQLLDPNAPDFDARLDQVLVIRSDPWASIGSMTPLLFLGAVVVAIAAYFDKGKPKRRRRRS